MAVSSGYWAAPTPFTGLTAAEPAREVTSQELSQLCLQADLHASSLWLKDWETSVIFLHFWDEIEQIHIQHWDS